MYQPLAVSENSENSENIDRHMIDINEKIFEIAYSDFEKLVKNDIIENNSDFRNHALIVKNENYKYDILEEAKNKLISNTWKESDFGKGRILDCVINSINLSINNLVDWRKKDDFKKLKANRENEELLFDFFKSKISDETAFNQFYEFGFSYQLIAYLFFIKNSQKYMPISQDQFDKIFGSLGIEFNTSHNCSWENYLEFNEIIKQFRKLLSKRFKNVSLLDAHSFLWIYGFQFNEPNEDNKTSKSNSSKNDKPEIKQPEKPSLILETYQPKKALDLDSLIENESEIDYLENLRKQMEIGDLAEKIVLKSEIEFLETDFPELAKQVRLVSNNPKLGFDILSFETDGKQKQIEVKAISENKSRKSFIISRNEFSKSKIYSNYYVYCVSDIYSEKPKILRLKNPVFENNDDFLIEPLTYRITFE